MSRAGFLKAAGAAAAFVAATTGAYKTLDYIFSDAKKHERQSEVVIVKKNYLEPSSIVSFDPLLIINNPQGWVLTVRIGDKESGLHVSEAVYDSVKVGSKITVKYDDRFMQAIEAVADRK